MRNFDYDAPAEFFSNAPYSKRRQFLGYRRFENGAEAVQFAVEQLSEANLAGAILESEEERYSPAAIRELYDSPEYPLRRRSPPAYTALDVQG
jgi:hypothetical protein